MTPFAARMAISKYGAFNQHRLRERMMSLPEVNDGSNQTHDTDDNSGLSGPDRKIHPDLLPLLVPEQ
jgi:hypothetical protein